MNYENAKEAAEFIRSKYPEQIEIVLVLGSGLGAFADDIENPVKIRYEEIPHFSRSTVEGHVGQLVLGKVEGVSVAVQQGRFHYYEGYEMPQVIFPMRTFGVLGVKTLIVTNAAGSLNPDFPQGSLMLIRDHLNLMGTNPLRGANDERFGPRFPDMTEVYSTKLREIALNQAAKMNLNLGEGVYCALSGPTYETPAEIKMFGLLGADAVGMSTVPEAITARHQSMEVIGISCITNLAAGLSGETINHAEVMETGAKVAKSFKELLRRIIGKISEGEKR